MFDKIYSIHIIILILRSGIMGKLIKRFMKNEAGATAIEYGLIAALIAVVLIGAVSRLGNTVSGKFNTVSTAVAR